MDIPTGSYLMYKKYIHIIKEYFDIVVTFVIENKKVITENEYTFIQMQLVSIKDLQKHILKEEKLNFI